MVLLVVLGFVLCAVGALAARVGRRWLVPGAMLAAIGLAIVVYELIFCDCS